MQETPLEGFETPEKTAREQTRLMHLEMQRTLEEDASLKPLYEKRLKDQARIDELKVKIRRFEDENVEAPLPDELKIPRELITNTFHQAYYGHKGWVK